jgi:hypothetical protein
VDVIIRATLIGIGATALIDLWALALNRAFGISLPDYAMVGRWLGYMPAGRFRHANIAAAPPIRGEAAIGWIAHYAIGIIFAALLLTLCGRAWAARPSLAPALAVGFATVVAPFFVMQPALGLGAAASKTAKPNVARLRSLVTHGIFGAGLYGAAWILAWVVPQQ